MPDFPCDAQVLLYPTVSGYKEFKFPRAKMRHYFTYVGQNYHAFCFEWEFESLDDLQKGWEEWDEMAEEMVPYLEKCQELVVEHLGNGSIQLFLIARLGLRRCDPSRRSRCRVSIP
jgi:hypothetical protein